MRTEAQQLAIELGKPDEVLYTEGRTAMPDEIERAIA